MKNFLKHLAVGALCAAMLAGSAAAGNTAANAVDTTVPESVTLAHAYHTDAASYIDSEYFILRHTGDLGIRFSTSLPGDVDHSGTINALDVILEMKVLVGDWAAYWEYGPDGFDLNLDGKVNSRDVIGIMKTILGSPMYGGLQENVVGIRPAQIEKTAVVCAHGTEKTDSLRIVEDAAALDAILDGSKEVALEASGEYFSDPETVRADFADAFTNGTVLAATVASVPDDPYSIMYLRYENEVLKLAVVDYGEAPVCGDDDRQIIIVAAGSIPDGTPLALVVRHDYPM